MDKLTPQQRHANMLAIQSKDTEPDETSLPKLAQVNGNVNRVDNEKVVRELFQMLSQACPSIAQVSPKQIFNMLDCCKEKKSLTELMEALSASSRRTFVRQIVNPFMEASLIELTHPENPRHPKQLSSTAAREYGGDTVERHEAGDDCAEGTVEEGIQV